MTTTFLIISFLIHILLIYTVYHLFQQLQSTKAEHKAELNSLLGSIIDEMKLENDRFEQKLTAKSQVTEKPRPSNTLQQQQQYQTQAKESFIDYDKLLDEAMNADKIETSIEAQVFQMYQEGKTIEEIARKTKRGKTEVTLMLKLSIGSGLNA